MHAEGRLLDFLSAIGARWLGGLLPRRLRLPLLVGCIVAGIVIGPQALGIGRQGAEAQPIAGLGVIMSERDATMRTDAIARLIAQVDEADLSRTVHHLARDPLPFRKVNYTRPGQTKASLDEADDYIEEKLRSWGYGVEREACQVQAFRCDASKPKAHQYSTPDPADPWYTAYNLYAKKVGASRPDETIVAISHKDSQSWVDSPGAYDNAVGTAATLEIARLLADYPSQCTMWFVFCNEEHVPWTSIAAAQNAKARGDNLIAIFNIDSLGGKPQADLDAGLRTNCTYYTTPEGERLAHLMAEVNEAYALGLHQYSHLRDTPGDDDGSFINAGYPAAIANIGSYPYGDPNYHTEADAPERVDFPNVRLAAQASLAAILTLDQGWR